MYLQLAVSSMFEPFFVLEGVGLLDSRDAIRRHGAEGSLNTERVWVVLAGSSSILSKRQNVPISHIVERAVPISHKRKIPVPLNHNPPLATAHTLTAGTLGWLYLILRAKRATLFARYKTLGDPAVEWLQP